MDSAEIDAQEKRVLEAMAAFRKEAIAYRKLAKKPPVFLKDGQPTKLRSDALEGARLFSDRFKMVKALLSQGVGAEIGVQFGDFSRFLLDQIQPKKLFLYDLTSKNIRQDVQDDDRTILSIGDSSSCLARSDDESFDWIYVDGDHSRIGVQKDTDVARRKIKPGGVLIFNDYISWSIVEVMPYGVMPVVNDLINEGYPVLGVALAPHGYFDIAIRYQPL